MIKDSLKAVLKSSVHNVSSRLSDSSRIVSDFWNYHLLKELEQMKRCILFVWVILAFMIIPAGYAGKTELTTYYPSPHGEYKQLQANDSSTTPTTPFVLRNDFGTTLDLKSVGIGFRGGNGYWARIFGSQQVSNDWNRGKLSFTTRTSDALGDQEKMTILANGNVGIGTTNPQGKFGVSFNNDDQIVMYSPADNIMAIQTTLDGQPLGTYGGDQNRLALQPLVGNVCIGTTTPTSPAPG